jgi:hypothetical protein
MRSSPVRHLYRSLRRAVICAALLSVPLAARAQYARSSPTSKGPRATAVLQLQGKRARIIPIVIMINGQFYDASIYRADPRPMALDPGVVYEAQRNGSSVGLFTVGNAVQAGNAWYGVGDWQTKEDMQRAREARAKQEEQAKAVQRAEAQAEDSGPPVLRKSGPAKPQPSTAPSAQKPASSPPQPAAKSSPPPSPPPANSSPDEYDPNRPVLRRGAPAPSSSGEAWPAQITRAPTSTAAPNAAAAQPKIEQYAAISDAAGPELRPYTFDLKPEERAADYKKMLGYAQAAVSNYERARHPDFASAQLGAGDLQVFDVDLSNEPVFVLTTPATVNFGAAARRAASRRSARRTAQLNEPVPGKQEQAYVTAVGRIDLYGELKLIFSSVTDSMHLDEIPRLQLIDAVDVDGDGRGELLFQETTDYGKGYIIYRVYPDQLSELFNTQGPEQ